MKKSIGAKDLIFPAPVLIVGTYSNDGKPNAMNVAWGGICSSNPPCIAISIRENRRTHKNILDKKAFTINIPNEKQVEEADFFGLVSGNTYDKFESVNLTAVKGDKIDAPYIEEFPINIECELMDMIIIGEHTQFIGRILDIKIDDEYFNESGIPDIEKISPLVFDPSNSSYYKLGGFVDKAFSAGAKLIKK